LIADQSSYKDFPIQRRIKMTNLFKVTTKAVAIAGLLALACLAAFAQGPSSYPPTWVYARAYNGWSVIGQQASTYTFNGAVCYYSPYNNGQTAPIFDFAGYQGSTLVYNPVFVQDASPALNEIVTPTSVTNTSASCGFSASFANSHTSFTLTSGTAGLQEAITNQLQNTPVFDVVLDKYWYQLVSAFPSTTTPQSIIGSVTGSANVGLVDTTTSPWTFYSWNGSKYIADAPTGGVPFTSLTAIAAPASALTTACGTAPCVSTATTGGSIAASSTNCFILTYVTALGGETVASSEAGASGSCLATGSGTSTNTYTVTSPAAETGAVAYRLYVGATTAEVLASSCLVPSTGQIVLPSAGACAIGTSSLVTALPTGTATAPAVSGAFPVASGTTSPLQNLVSYPPFAVVGASLTTSASATMGVVNLPAGLLNTLGRSIRICGEGFVSSTTTGDVFTISTTLTPPTVASVVTPWSAVTAADTASKTIPISFCSTWVTSVTGASGKIESHGWLTAGIAGVVGSTGTAVGAPYLDTVVAASSAIDLTKSDQIGVVITTGASHGLAAGGAQLRQLTVEVLQ
jgi:hypothetical protein